MEGKGAVTYQTIDELIYNMKKTGLISSICEGHPFVTLFSDEHPTNEGYAELDFNN